MDIGRNVMTKIKMVFYLLMIDFISDWYSVNRMEKKSSQQMSTTFANINRLRGRLRDMIDKEGMI